jgi:hypothetical protein
MRSTVGLEDWIKIYLDLVPEGAVFIKMGASRRSINW